MWNSFRVEWVRSESPGANPHRQGPQAHRPLRRQSVTRSERTWGLFKQAGAAEPALPGRRRSAPSGGRELRAASERGGLLFPSRGRGTGFAGPQAQRPLGGQRVTRSERTWGRFLPKQGPQNRLCRAAGAAPPRGGRELHAVNECGGLLFPSRGRGTGFAGPQAQRPLGGQRATRSERTWGHYL